MTEAEWEVRVDPSPLLEYLRGKASDRKLRLLGCACCRRYWVLLPIGVKEAVQTVERFVDGVATAAEFSTRVTHQEWHTRQSLRWRGLTYRNGSLWYDDHIVAVTEITKAYVRHPQEGAGIQAAYLRDIFGNPFRPDTFSPSWRTNTAVLLARTIYESRDFSAMPILADALQDAGCDDADILNHCRSEGPHVRGCWVCDLVLGKE